MTQHPPYILAHRGFHETVPENTISAFTAAHDLGCHGIELDVQLTIDGQPVVFHDPQLFIPRTGELFKIRQLTLEKLEKLSREVFGEAIPTLEEVLDRFVDGFQWINIELKRQVNDRENNRLIQSVQLVLEKFPTQSFILSSFHPLLIKRMKEWDRDLKTAFLFQPRTVVSPFWKSCLQYTQANFFHPRYDWFFTQHAAIPKVNVSLWTMDECEPYGSFVKSSTQVFSVISNRPDLWLKYL